MHIFRRDILRASSIHFEGPISLNFLVGMILKIGAVKLQKAEACYSGNLSWGIFRYVVALRACGSASSFPGILMSWCPKESDLRPRQLGLMYNI